VGWRGGWAAESKTSTRADGQPDGRAFGVREREIKEPSWVACSIRRHAHQESRALQLAAFPSFFIRTVCAFARPQSAILFPMSPKEFLRRYATRGPFASAFGETSAPRAKFTLAIYLAETRMLACWPGGWGRGGGRRTEDGGRRAKVAIELTRFYGRICI
jgi:hypothetical protein